jgi:hypothetical protein
MAYEPSQWLLVEAREFIEAVQEWLDVEDRSIIDVVLSCMNAFELVTITQIQNYIN